MNKLNTLNFSDLTQFTLQDKIGQMLLIGFRGLQLEEGNPIFRDITEIGIGGVILFDYDVLLNKAGRNIESPDQVRSLLTSLQKLANLPLFLSIDQEGGNVNRLKPEYGFPDSMSHQKIGEVDDLEFTSKQAGIIAQTLSGIGFNLNFAPVVDLNLNPQNPIIGGKGRCFSDNPQKVTEHASAYIKAHRRYNVISTVKHFPGHGSSKDDTHLGMADVTDTWKDIEITPYRNLINQGLCDMVMTTHIFNANLDSKYPATLSHTIQAGILREQLGYDGVLISDDLQMKAIANHFSLDDAVRLSIDAGVDILTLGNNTAYEPEKTHEMVDIISDQVKKGNISESRIDKSFERIMKLKQRFLKFDI